MGNSFSEDAVENYLYDLARAENKIFIIGNLFIGGCSLERHWNNMNQDAPAYSYRKIDANGLKTKTEQHTLKQGLRDEAWDYISFQQVSQNSGLIDSYFPYLTDLKKYARRQALNPKVQFVLHQTWAYAKDASHGGFANYNRNQSLMYQSIVKSVNQAAARVGITKIIPSGTAIQNARSSWLGDWFCRDGFHLQIPLGRYVAACTWFEALTGVAVLGNSSFPPGLAKEEVKIAQTAAHFAVVRPFEITDMSRLDF
ncbi:MAG: DUF4886 domain-containing protein [Dysgonamonadaceae bacterium]|nr:DUF4886 domain-containing protein [Dysgonamonadaceae bacterium]